jgi:hypothetical protein
MAWQGDLYHEITAALPASASVRAHGSVLTPALLDGWSDLDLQLHLGDAIEVAAIIDPSMIWACDNVTANGAQVLRMVLVDGRRLDLTVGGRGQIRPPTAADDNAVRFIAALAAAKLGRGDQLIGLDLTLELLRCCLEQAMLLRDQDTGNNVHRHGTKRDALAAAVAQLACQPLTIEPRPNVVERTAELYSDWRRERDPNYNPDWSGLDAVIRRGLGDSLPGPDPPTDMWA